MWFAEQRLRSSLLEPCGDASSQGHLQVLSHLYTSSLMRSSIDQPVCVDTDAHTHIHTCRCAQSTQNYELTSNSIYIDMGLHACILHKHFHICCIWPWQPSKHGHYLYIFVLDVKRKMQCFLIYLKCLFICIGGGK